MYEKEDQEIKLELLDIPSRSTLSLEEMQEIITELRL